MLEDPWQDGAIPVRFHEEEQSAETIVAAAASRPIDGIIVVGDRPTLIGAYVAKALGLPGHPPEAAVVARHKLFTRERMREHGLLVPWFISTPVERDPHEIKASYPCVVKPVALSASRGVMRADSPDELAAAFFRLRALLRSPDIRAERNHAHDMAIVEGFIPGREFALEGLLHQGRLTVLALFDKPDPLDGPFFEETIYLTPSSVPPTTQAAIVDAVVRAATAIGLWHGPIHAECRVSPSTDAGQATSGQTGVFVLEVAARPIGGLCARSLRFAGGETLEELLLRHALGESPDGWRREARASGVMMIPIPQRGVFRRVEGLDEARRVAGVDDIRITAKTDQVLVPLPEGASYLGFIFAGGDDAHDVDAALRAAHARLTFVIDPELPISRVRPDPLQSHHG